MNNEHALKSFNKLASMNNTHFEIKAVFRFDQETVAEESMHAFLHKAPLNHYGVKAAIHMLDTPPMGRMLSGRYLLRLEARSHPNDGLGFIQLHEAHWKPFKGKLCVVMYRPLAQSSYDSPFALCDVEAPWQVVDLTKS
jgi:hypothetical protein